MLPALSAWPAATVCLDGSAISTCSHQACICTKHDTCNLLGVGQLLPLYLFHTRGALRTCAQLRLGAASAQTLGQCSRLKASWGRASLRRQANSAAHRGPTRCLGLPLGCPCRCRCRCPRCRCRGCLGCRRRCRRWLAAAPVGSAGRSFPAWCPASSASLLQVYREHTERDEVSNCRSRGKSGQDRVCMGLCCCAAPARRPRCGQEGDTS